MARRDSSEKTKPSLTLRLSAEIRELLDDESAREGLSLSQLVDRKLRVAYGLAPDAPGELQEQIDALEQRLAAVEAALEKRKG